MRALVQRVREGKVSIAGEIAGSIGQGLVILLGVGAGDRESDADYLADRCARMRIFEDEDGKMNRSLLDVNGEALVISQFTLYGDPGASRRPSFSAAARPEVAIPLYERFIAQLRLAVPHVATGRFGADMLVEIHNDGPVTLLAESKPR